MERMKETAKYIVYFMQTLRWQSKLGLLFIGIGLLLLFFQIFSGEQQLNSLKAQLAKVREQKVTQAVVLPEPDIHEEFYALLPKQGHVNQQISEILNMASEHNLQIEKASYAVPKIADSSLSKHQIRMPLNGSYTQIRHFVNQILNQHANVALNEVSFAREDISSEIVSANILFTLYLK
jgi:Tfp pilus assembly protein PilO